MANNQRPPMPQDGKSYAWYNDQWVECVDMTPKWVDVTSVYITAIRERRSDAGYDAAVQEVYRMAAIADQRNELMPIMKDVLKYCEDQQIYDKLGAHGDFYYKLKKATGL